MNRKTELLARAYFVVIVFTIIALVIAYRVLTISFVEGDKWRAKGARNIQWKEVNADRGNIYADDESLLATSIQFFELRMDLKVISQDLFKKEVDSLALMLSTTIRPDKSPADWKRDLKAAKAKGNSYYFIKNNLDIEELNLVKTFPLLRYSKYKGGRIEIRHSKRVKPYRELASRTIGSDRENAQKVGIEGYFDRFLKGPNDKRLMKRVSEAHDIWLPVYDPSEFNMRRGDDIKTTINVHLQDVMHTELSQSLLKYNAVHAVGVLMEVKTGAIKAISNLSNYDGKVMEVRNISIGNSTEPGSTFKLATALAMMDDTLADLDTKVNISGGVARFYDRNMHDSERHHYNEVTLKTAFAISSNVGIAKLAHEHYNYSEEARVKFRRKLEQFGLSKPIGIEIEGEGKPVIKDPIKNKKEWYGTTIPWMAHGYELRITPLQMLNFYNSVANNGKMMKPYIVSDIIKDDGEVKTFLPKVIKEQIASEYAISQAKEMLREVVINGTAKNINSKEIEIAGKTGTTRVNYSNKEEYAKYNASFCGYFPADDPIYSMIIVLYEPKGVFYGSAVAAPVFKAVAERTIAWRHEMTKPMNIADSEPGKTLKNNVPEGSAGYKGDFETIFDYVGIQYKKKSDQTWVEVDPFESRMLIENKNVTESKVPDVRGMGARDAIYVLENLGLQVAVHGRGKVAKQTINPGTRLAKQKIELYLN